MEKSKEHKQNMEWRLLVVREVGTGNDCALGLEFKLYKMKKFWRAVCNSRLRGENTDLYAYKI